MTSYPPFRTQRPSPLPTIFAGAALVIAAFLFLDRGGWFQRAPNAEPRAVTPRGDLMEFEKTTTSIFEKYAPSVVHITTEAYARTMFGRQKYQEGTGTGFLWDDTGIVVTNYHVVQPVVEAGHQLKVAIADELFDAGVVGTSKENDIAVIRVAAAPRGLSPIPLGSSAELKVGQFVLAIGNPYGFDRSLSTGTISALGRNITTENAQMAGLIQTDAAINPGNSGGPLLDSAGRLIGMNTAIYSPSGTSAGIGFAVPVDTINDVVPSLIDGKSAQRHLGIKPYVQGVRLPASTGFSVGVPVVEVEAGAGAAAAGIRPFQLDDDRVIEWGDTITAIEGKLVRSPNDLSRYLRGKKRGEVVKVTLVRGQPERAQVVEVPVALK